MKKHDIDFRPIPFYFVNDRIEKDEVELQLQRMQESGISGFYLHARCGLEETGYGNKKWYEDMDYITRRAQAYGLEVWLYDEDAYPSGNAGGRIAMEHPEYVAQKLNVMKVPVEKGKCRVVLGECRPLRAYGVQRTEQGIKTLDLTEHFGVARDEWYGKEDAYVYFLGTKPTRHIRSAAYNPQILFFCEEVPKDTEVYVAFARRCYAPNRFGSLVDNLNKDCVDLFKEYAYESYYRQFSEEALSNVRGMFTDEPVAGGMPPWTPEIERVFEEKKGYKIQDHYFRLIENFDDFCSEVRRDYWQVASFLFQENYVRNLHSFCKEKEIDFVGHFENEETPLYQSLKGVNVYAALWELDHSGFDLISNAASGRENVRPIFGAKLASSVSVQKGNQRTLCEIFGVNPFNFGLDGMKKMAGWAFIFGADTLVPHAFYYGYAGLRKYDAGKSFFFQDPNFKDFPKFSRYVDRIGKRLYEGESTSDTLLVYPNWEFVAYAFLGDAYYAPFADKFFEAFKTLLDLHVEFDITDCEYINDHFEKEGARVGNKTYKNIIYLSSGNVVMDGILEKVKGTGARVFDFSNGQADLEELKASAFRTPLTTVKGDCREVNTLYKKGKEGDWLFLYNASPKNNVVSLNAAFPAYVYDADEDEYYKVEAKAGEITLSLEGYSFTCLLLSDKEIETSSVYRCREYADKEYEFEKTPDWTYLPPVDLKGCITRFDVSVRSSRRSEEFIGAKPLKVQQLFGIDAAERFQRISRPIHDDAPIKTEYPVECVYRSEFVAQGAKKMLFEECTLTGEYTLYLNGKELDKTTFKKERVYDFRNLVCDVTGSIRDGQNVLEIKFSKASANDGLTGEIYFI